MEVELPKAKKSVLQIWVKPAVIILIVFGVGFLLPQLTKNLVTKKSGIAPSPVPTESMAISGPGFRFNPEMLELVVGEQKTIAVLLKSDKDKIEAFDFVLNYDEKLVNVVSVKTSSLFPTYPILEYGGGVIRVSGIVGVADPVRLDETVFLIEFKGVAGGKVEAKINMDGSAIAAQGKNILDANNSLVIKVKDKP